jgi:hypothetical protein
MKASNTIIVISRHQKDTSWTQKLVGKGFHVAVYDHDISSPYPYTVPTHKGRESAVYFKYIIDHYDSLMPYTVFLHDDEYTWHHAGSIVDLVVQAKPAPYRNLNNRCMASILKGNILLPTVKKFYNKFLKAHLGPLERYEDWTTGDQCCAQFVLHRNRIRRYPKAFYEAIYNWFLTDTTLDDRSAGHMLEWTYNLIFDNPFKDQKLKRKEYSKRQEYRDVHDSSSCRKIVDYST